MVCGTTMISSMLFSDNKFQQKFNLKYKQNIHLGILIWTLFDLY